MCTKENSEVMIITQNGKTIRLEASEIRQAGRSTQGVRLVTLEEGDRVAAASVIQTTEEENGGQDGQGALPLQ
jgi:DNA gyrase subunit A